MITVNTLYCKSGFHFPNIKALPTIKEKNFLKRTWNFFTYRRKWAIQTDYCLWVPSLSTWIFIPKRFVFDGANMPKILHSLFNPMGMLLFGAPPLDFGYKYQGLLHVDPKGTLRFVKYTHSELDTIFEHLCAYESGMELAAEVAAFFLRIFGFLGWRKNRKANCILVDDFPEIFV
jgi:hypothetical protein